jgi:hypothetical protein
MIGFSDQQLDQVKRAAAMLPQHRRDNSIVTVTSTIMRTGITIASRRPTPCPARSAILPSSAGMATIERSKDNEEEPKTLLLRRRD